MTFEHNPPTLKLLGAALVVEDNPIIAIDTQTILEDIGFSPVEVLASLSEGLQTLANHIFSFAILDVRIGDEDSIRFAENLAERGSQIVFASGYSDAETLPPPFRNHVIIGKPYTKAQLEAVLLRCPGAHAETALPGPRDQISGR
ncbi:response regulator [Stappia sp.]|uniref:response regulator n=1 Tax=Stappia sp. TaxID=1870903 RepID=UPI003C7B5DEA